MKNLIFLADAHINDEPKEILVFQNFLKSIKSSTKALCILGDLFDLWLAKKRLEQNHQSKIINQFRELRMAGVRLIYIEGNRDFHIKRAYLGDPFDKISDDEWVEVFDGKKFYIHHGDRVNVDDAAYHLWKKISKSKFVWSIFNSLPFKVKIAIAGYLERMLRGTNIKHKSCFPQKRFEEFGAKILRKDYYAAVIGHLHKENVLEFNIDSQKKMLYSLPAWKLEKRYLLFEPGREGRFVNYSE